MLFYKFVLKTLVAESPVNYGSATSQTSLCKLGTL